jgi:hypothetical protein
VWFSHALLLAVAVLACPLLGCAIARNDSSLPGDRGITRDQLLIYSDFELPRQHRLLDELTAQRRDLADKLQLPMSDEPIHVYLFDTSKRYRAFIRKHFPDFPDRRAFFVETDTRLAVYAHWGDRIAEDLRHEVAHGYLHAAVPNLPLCLDEGLAEYFETPRGRNGVNRPHVELLVRRCAANEWTPDLRRLEQLSSVDEMTQEDYAESWAWVHFLLETAPHRRELLCNHLARLRMTSAAPELWPIIQQADPNANRALVAHLLSLSQ